MRTFPINIIFFSLPFTFVSLSPFVSTLPIFHSHTHNPILLFTNKMANMIPKYQHQPAQVKISSLSQRKKYKYVLCFNFVREKIAKQYCSMFLIKVSVFHLIHVLRKKQYQQKRTYFWVRYKALDFVLAWIHMNHCPFLPRTITANKDIIILHTMLSLSIYLRFKFHFSNGRLE